MELRHRKLVTVIIFHLLIIMGIKQLFTYLQDVVRYIVLLIGGIILKI